MGLSLRNVQVTVFENNKKIFLTLVKCCLRILACLDR